MPAAKQRSLQDLLDTIPNLVEHFRNDTLAPHGKDRAGLSPVPMEFSNWREEQKGWRESIALFDQSHHMPETFLSGPDARKLLSHIGINSLAGFTPLKAKQFIGCNSKGQVIGECVLECLAEDSFELISGMHLQNWIQYTAETGGYDVQIVRDHPTSMNPTGRTRFRFGMDGPHAEALFREVIEEDPGEIKFFNMARVRIAGCDVLALRHGMAGHKGVELSGDFADGPKVRARLIEAGRKYDLRVCGMKTYYSTLGETGWVGYPTPAIYTDPALEGFRRWLRDDGWEACTQIGGSFVSDNIEDYYVTPWDLGVDRLIKFDHDFVGRTALEAMAEGPHRRKVTLVWNPEDVSRIQASLMSEDLPYKYMELPMASYAFQMNDEVRARDGRLVGVSNFVGYTVNEKAFLSVAFVEAAHAEPGTEVTVTWGEPDGGTCKPSVERHRQFKVRAVVQPAPYANTVRALKNSRLAMTA